MSIVETGTGIATRAHPWPTAHGAGGSGGTAPDEAMNRLFQDTREYFSLPYPDPTTYEVPDSVDALSIGDVIDDMHLDEDAHACPEAHCARMKVRMVLAKAYNDRLPVARLKTQARRPLGLSTNKER